MGNTSLTSNSSKIAKLIFSLFLPLAIGGASGSFARDEINGQWFSSLAQASCSPPNYLFGPVWTTMYLIMGISMLLIWRAPKTDLRQKALIVFGIQLFCNFSWSMIFFTLHIIPTSVIVIILIWIIVLYTIIFFKKIYPLAAYLQTPYFFRLTYATVVNVPVWFLNK